MASKTKICIKVYFNPTNFPIAAGIAEKMKKRRGGLQLFTQKKHGLAGQQVANTDGIGRALKAALWAWDKNEASRLEKAAEFARREENLRKEREDAERAGLI